MKRLIYILLLCIVFTSCRTVKEIEYQTKIVYDTLEVITHDTTVIKEIQHDSVDRYVEKTIYVDSNGVVHEKEIQRLTHYIAENNEIYQRKESELKEKIADLERQLEQKETVVEVEKELNWFQKTLMVLGVCMLITIAVVAVRWYLKLKMKI